MNGFSIIPECYIDTCLTETITGCFNQFNHQKSCGKVSKLMQENFKDSFALGIIDKDKREITYIKEFELLASKDSLYLYKHQTKHHYIIQISPAMEKFFMKAADEKGINIANYELPTDLKGLTKVTKQISGQNEAAFKKFKRLFKDLVDASEVATLAGLIKYIGENMYNVDVEEVKGLLG